MGVDVGRAFLASKIIEKQNAASEFTGGGLQQLTSSFERACCLPVLITPPALLRDGRQKRPERPPASCDTRARACKFRRPSSPTRSRSRTERSRASHRYHSRRGRGHIDGRAYREALSFQ